MASCPIMGHNANEIAWQIYNKNNQDASIGQYFSIYFSSHLHKNDFAVCHKTKNKEKGIVRLQDAIHSIEKAPLEIKLIHFRV